MIPPEDAGEYAELRVVAAPDYDFTWSLLRNPHLGEPEVALRRFLDQVAKSVHLTNIKVMRRTITVGPWEELADVE